MEQSAETIDDTMPESALTGWVIRHPAQCRCGCGATKAWLELDHFSSAMGEATRIVLTGQRPGCVFYQVRLVQTGECIS